MNEYERIKASLLAEGPQNYALYLTLLSLLEVLARREREEQAEAQKMVGG